MLPEITIVHNPVPERWRKVMAKHRRRRVRRNFKLRVKYRGKLRTYRALRKLLKTSKRAIRYWKKAAKYHGKTPMSRAGLPHRRHKGRRRHARRFGSRRRHHAKRFGSRRHRAKRFGSRKHSRKHGRKHGRRRGHRRMSSAMRSQASKMRRVWKKGSKTRAKLMAMSPRRRFAAAARMASKLAAN
jgi:hypothetical protein